MTEGVFATPKSPDEAIAQNKKKKKLEQQEKNFPGTTILKPRLPVPPGGSGKGNLSGSGSPDSIVLEPTKDYKWNLPPHRFSLPVRPVQVQKELFEGKGRPGLDIPDSYRRGRMWWYANANQTYTTSDADGKEIKQRTGKQRRYGFQFLWNPESYSTSVQLNTDVTPSVADRFVGVAGLFPSGETISFSLRLDRTNDFYHMRNMLKKDYSANLGQYVPPPSSDSVFESMAKFYQTSLFSNTGGESMGKKIKTLMELGTIADLEYLFIAINGPGFKNVIGRPTGDIGFLSATLLRIDIGPSSYVGYVNSLNINHIAFSQDMTPIRTDVQVSMNLMASAGLASTGTAAAVAP